MSGKFLTIYIGAMNSTPIHFIKSDMQHLSMKGPQGGIQNLFHILIKFIDALSTIEGSVPTGSTIHGDGHAGGVLLNATLLIDIVWVSATGTVST